MTDKELEQLFDRFASDEISETEQQRLIDHIESHPDSDMPDGFESRLINTIDRLSASETTRRDITIQSRRTPLRIIAGIAASIAVVTAIGIHMFTTPAALPPTPQDTCATPEEAYAQAQRALAIFSATLDKGVRQVEMVQNTADEVQSKVAGKLKLKV